MLLGLMLLFGTCVSKVRLLHRLGGLAQLVRATSDGCKSVSVENKVTSIKLIIPESSSGRIRCLTKGHSSGWLEIKDQFFGNRAVRIPDSIVSLLFCITNLVFLRNSFSGKHAWEDGDN